MAVDGVRLTIPRDSTGDGNDDVYFGRGNIQVQIEQSRNWLLSGGSSVIGFASGLFNQVGSSGFLSTPLASGHLGAAGGSHVFEISFDQWEGNADSWGPSSATESAEEKLVTLDMEIAKAEIDSLNPAKLEFSILSDDTGGIDDRYQALPVVVTQISPTMDFEQSPNLSRMRVTLAETVDLTRAIDGADTADGDPVTVNPDYLLSSPGATDDVPIAADTLGAGGQGTGRQRQGNETSPSGLASKNAASGSNPSPTTQNTKITPTSVQLNGAFRGKYAADLADRLKTQYLSNEDVDTVTLDAPNVTGTNPITGDYTLTNQSYIDPIIPRVNGGVYGYRLDLEEV